MERKFCIVKDLCAELGAGEQILVPVEFIVEFLQFIDGFLESKSQFAPIVGAYLDANFNIICLWFVIA